jgi:hypothetical protein
LGSDMPRRGDGDAEVTLQELLDRQADAEAAQGGGGPAAAAVAAKGGAAADGDPKKRPKPAPLLVSDRPPRGRRSRQQAEPHVSLDLGRGLGASTAAAPLPDPRTPQPKAMGYVPELHAAAAGATQASASRIDVRVELFASSPKPPIKALVTEHEKKGAREGSPTGSDSGGRAARKAGSRRRHQKAVAASASREFGDDLKFLQGLLGDQTVHESDVKDIVGSGIRYLHERHQVRARAGRGG